MSFYQVDYIDLVDKFVPHFLYDYDFNITDGDMRVSNTADQDSHFILVANKGQYRYDVKIGVGLYKYINAPVNKVVLAKLIREQLTSDGFKVKSINILNEDDIAAGTVSDSSLVRLIKDNKFIIDLNIER